MARAAFGLAATMSLTSRWSTVDAGERRIGGDLAEFGDQSRLLGAGERAAVEVERRRRCD